ncbi:MAG: glycosyltransferase family 4 protein [Lachnospiraceae bacterium]|nr:glycosyltransferase family 4 protein [Lachnospiraceae bacterium]
MIGHKRIPSREGGVEIVVEELSVRFAEKGCFVDAYNRSGYHVAGKEYDDVRYKDYKDVHIITVPTFRNGKLNAIVYSVLATIRALFRGYDVFHYHAEGPCIMLWLPRLFGKKIVATIHGLDWQRAKWGGFATRMLKHGEKNAARYADEVIVLSKSMQKYFLETYGRKTVYIPNGISRPEKAEAREMIEKWGIQAYNYILFLARIVPEKGLHYLIEAYEKLDTDLKLVIAGGGSNAADYMAKIKKHAEENEKIIMTYFVQGRKLEELLSNAAFFVLPSDVEGMAISLLEAMSYGNCCIVSDIPENTEVVEDHAVTFRKGDPEDLREKLEYLITHPEEAAKYRENAAEFILSKHNWDRVAEETLRVYRSVMEGKPYEA